MKETDTNTFKFRILETRKCNDYCISKLRYLVFIASVHTYRKITHTHTHCILYSCR